MKVHRGHASRDLGPAIGDVEIWTIEGNNGWSHPVTSTEEGFILSKDGEVPGLGAVRS